MKLLYIVNQIHGPGGLERVLSIKASYLAEHYGYEIHFITLNQNETKLFYSFNSKLTFHNIEAIGNPFKYIKQYRKGIQKIIQKIQPDVISVCDDGLKGLFLPLIVGKQCPMIYERHVSKNIEIKKDKQSFFDKLITATKFKLMDFGGSYYDTFVVLTNGNAKEWNLKNCTVIPNPLSFYPKNSEVSTLKNKLVLAVGKQSFQKGYDRLLKSWQLVVENHPDWSLSIYGTINKNQGLDKLAYELGIQNNVNFYEPEKKIGKKYREASIYVMSSRYEGFGMVLTEAMAYGVPCVSFDCPYGPSDIINHKVNGILVKNDDTTTFASSITTLIANKNNIRNNMGEKAREDVQCYLPEKIALKWDALFKRLIHKK